jgi:cyanate permease
MSLLAFFEQLAESQWSIDLHESQYAYSIIESIHVWTLCLFFGTVAMVDLRLLGWILPKVPFSEFGKRVLPWTVAGFIIMVITGTLLVYAIPVRTYQSIFFRTKMLLLVLAGLNLLIFHSRVFPSVAKWDVDTAPPKAARIAGALSLILWTGIVFSGRMIAYNWFDCDRQPQTAIVNFLTSCTPTD